VTVPLRRNRDFMLLQAGQLLSTAGTSMSGIAFPLLALAVTHSPAKAGLVQAARFTPLLVSLLAGVAADRHDRRRLMIGADVVSACAIGTLVAAIALDRVVFWQLLLVAFVDACGSVVFHAAKSGAFRSVVPRHQLPAASSVEMGRASTVRLAGPPVGGALYGLGRVIPFAADVASYAFSTASILLMRTPFQEARERDTSSLRAQLAEGLRFLWQIPLLRRLFSMRAILLSEFWAAYGVIAFLIWPNVYVLAGALAAQAFCFPNTDAALNSYRYAMTPDRLVSRVVTASTSIAVLAMPLGPLAAGLLLDSVSPRVTILALTAGTMLAAVVGTLSRAVRELPPLEDIVTPSASPAEAG
jgi:MFS family permease